MPPVVVAVAVVAVVVGGGCDSELRNLRCGLPAAAVVGGSRSLGLRRWHAPRRCRRRRGCRLHRWCGGGGGWQCMRLGATLADLEPPWLVGHAARVCIDVVSVVLVELAVHAAQSWVADCLPPPLLVGHAARACIGGMPIVVAIAVVAGFVLTASE